MSRFIFHSIGDIKIAELVPTFEIISDAQGVLDLIVECGMQGAHVLILHQESLHPDFFDLRTRIAGEIAQKAVNYQFRLIIIGEFAKYSSTSLRDFIREGNRGKSINFYGKVEEALEKLKFEL